MYCLCTSHCFSQQHCAEYFSKRCNLRRSINYAYGYRCNFLCVVSRHWLEQYNRLTGYSKSCCNNNVHCDRNLERMHCNSPSYSYRQSCSGCYCFSSGNNLCRTISFSFSRWCKFLYMDSFDQSEQYNRHTCFCKPSFNNNIYCHRNK